MRAPSNWWIPPEHYVLCMEEDDSLGEVSVVVEEWLQEEEERKDGMQLIQSRLLQCKCLARHKRIKNVRGSDRLENGSSSRKAGKTTTDQIKLSRESHLL